MQTRDVFAERVALNTRRGGEVAQSPVALEALDRLVALNEVLSGIRASIEIRLDPKDREVLLRLEGPFSPSGPTPDAAKFLSQQRRSSFEATATAGFDSPFGSPLLLGPRALDETGDSLGDLGLRLEDTTVKSDALNASLMAFPAGEQSEAVARLTRGYGGLATATELVARNSEAVAGLQQVLSGVADTLGNAAASAFDRVIFGGEKVSDVLRDLERQVLNVLTQELIFAPLREGIAGGLKGTTVPGGGIAGLLSGALSFFPSIFAHQGGVAGQLPVSGLVPASLFQDAQRFQGGGLVGVVPRLAPGEVPAILHQGETVRTPAQEAALQRGARNQRPMNFIMNVKTDDANSFRASRGQILAEMARALRAADRLNN